MPRDSRRVHWGIVLGTILGAALLAVVAGNLEPPGPPAPTMKTLDQVEPRIPISQSDIPLTITVAGSYYLTENIFAAAFGQDAITINADDVTLDLNGHVISDSQVGEFLNGVIASSGRQNIVVKDGTVRGSSGSGIDLNLATNTLVSRVISEGCSTGIVVGEGSMVTECTARGNSLDGIHVTGKGVVSGCNATSNGEEGITVSSGSVVIGCSASNNGTWGIIGNDGSTITGCAATQNQDGIGVDGGLITDCSARNNTGHGITGSQRSQIRNCTSSLNTGNGIDVGAFCSVVGNHCANNNAGIHSFQVGVHIEGNTVVDNVRGIDVDDTGGLIIGNRASDNSTSDYDIIAGNKVGTISMDPTTAGALDNLSY